MAGYTPSSASFTTFPSAFLVVKVADYTGKMIKDPRQIEFHIKAPGADFRSIPVMGIRYE